MPQSVSSLSGLTAAEQRALEYGIDLSLLEENLRLAPGERMRRHDEALSCAEELRKAWARKHESSARFA